MEIAMKTTITKKKQSTESANVNITDDQIFELAASLLNAVLVDSKKGKLKNKEKYTLEIMRIQNGGIRINIIPISPK
jgi:hypothetical protein